MGHLGRRMRVVGIDTGQACVFSSTVALKILAAYLSIIIKLLGITAMWADTRTDIRVTRYNEHK